MIVWGSLILAGAVVLLIVGRPFFGGGGRPAWMPYRDDSQGQDLIAQKESLLRAIKDVEFEFQNGTLSKEDRDALRDDYKRRAIQVLKAIKEQGRDTDREMRQTVEEEVANEVKQILAESADRPVGEGAKS